MASATERSAILCLILAVGMCGDRALAAGFYNLGAFWKSKCYRNEEPLTINHALVSGGPLSSFPVLVSITDANLKGIPNGGYVRSSSGYDLRFVAKDSVTCGGPSTCVLNYEIEKYDSATGQLIAWVSVPSLSSATDTVIYLDYGSSAVAATPHSGAGTWNSNFVGVWHFPDGSTLSLNDSTSDANNGTNSGATATSTAILDGAIHFDGSSTVDVGQGGSLNIPSAFTFSAWVYRSDSNVDRTLVCLPGITSFKVYSDNRVEVWNGATGLRSVSGGATLGSSTWYYIAGSYDAGSTTLTTYVNGVQDRQTTSAGAPTAGLNADALLGAGACGGSNYSGIMDELRISNVARPTGWLLTEYNTMNSPASFVTVGSRSSGCY